MTYRELKKYYWLKQRIEDIEKEIKHLEYLGAAPINDMPKGTKISNPTEQYAIKKEKLIEKLNGIKLKTINQQDEIESFISSIPDVELECLFRELFILGYKQKTVARKHHMDRTTVYYKIKNYLDSVADKEMVDSNGKKTNK